MSFLLALAVLLPGANPESAPVDFNREVRPILAAKCYACHGPDEKTRKAELRLDTKEGLFADLGGYFAVVSGQPEKSELLDRIHSTEEGHRMPPKADQALSPKQMETIERWIEQGANWNEHWAYMPVSRPAVPKASGETLAFNPIDEFIFQGLQQQNLQASPLADRRTLIRRLSFDLTGLPPTPEEVEAFVHDPDPKAYEKLVDRLLESPHYGERMAMYWLDLVRYADTNGYHGDNHRNLFLYRSYVIDSFNENKPFDQFTIEQLAGDLLPNPTSEQLVGSGYNRLLMTTREGGAQPKEYLAKYAADRVRNVSTVWMASTMGCCECHDHKYDPFSSKDFYRFASFFADLQEVSVGEQPQTPIPTAQQQATLANLDGQLRELQKVLETPTPELEQAQLSWEKTYADNPTSWRTIAPQQMQSQGNATFTQLDDGSIKVTGENPTHDVYTLIIPGPLSGITALRLEVLSDPQLPGKGPGRTGNGNFVLNEVEAKLGEQPVSFSQATATHSQNGWPVAGLIDGKSDSGWAILPKTGQDSIAVLQLTDDLQLKEGEHLTLQMHFNYGGSHTIGKFRLASTTAPRPVTAGSELGIPQPMLDILAIEREKRTPEQQTQLASYYRSIAPGLAEVRKQQQEITARRKALQESFPTTLISQSGQPRMMRVLPRGNWLDDSGEVVQPGIPSYFPQLMTEQRSSRLDLAKWITSPENPLTARVFVNRIWKLMYGRGLVSTLDDFGSQGTSPSHPELLDWLAVEFIDSGWDVKALVKLMVLSRTYQQSSLASPELRKADPYNQWLARQGRFRLDAEMIRDQALAISGLLVEKMEGPSAKPYQPVGYWAHLNFPPREWEADKGADQYRRGVYTYWCRTFLHPSLLAFDASTREECVVERPRSNTPLQALVLLNDPTYVEAARVLAQRLIREGGETPDQKLTLAFTLALSREPQAQEVTLLTELLQRHREQYRQAPTAAEQLTIIGLAPVPEDIPAEELAAWTSVARVILNLHETITRY